MADKEFTKICKEILAASEKISPLAEQAARLVDRIEQAKEATEQNAASTKIAKQKVEEILTSIEKLQIQIKAAANKVENAGALIADLNSLKEQIKTMLQTGLINDTKQSSVQTYSSSMIEQKLKTKLNKTDQAADSAKLGGVVARDFMKKSEYNPTNNALANTLVLRDANGDFAGRYVTAGHFRLTAPVQNNIFSKNNEILFRGGSKDDENYMRAVSFSLLSSTILPVGTIITSARATAPDGFLLCNGAAISRSAYTDLFSAIGTAYGAGDGSNTFNIPDLRGEFIRGADNGRGVDGGRALGSAQGDAIRNIVGGFAGYGDRFLINEFSGAFGHIGYASRRISVVGEEYNETSYNGANFDASRVVPTANENRPRNVAVNFYIKY
nr:MAG TPA: tail fiber protein [Caudoviricetes sp.]